VVFGLSSKTPPTFDIALRYSIQPALKGATKVTPTVMVEDVAKMPKKESLSLKDQCS